MPRTESSVLRRWALGACVALPLLMLAANVLAWLRWGTDLPFLDDWRAYDQQVAGSLSPQVLFQPTNNTIAPVGLALDSLAQRWLAGNPIAYQTLSMLGVLGLLLWLQWRLLRWVLGNRIALYLAFLCTVFMLQSGSYWGEQSLAYHQALPLLALLAATWLNFAAPPPGAWRLPLVFGLGALAGLSYISGAVGALCMGAAWGLLSWRMTGADVMELARRGRSGALALTLAGLLTLALQLALTRRAGADALGQQMRLTGPDERDFWLYLAGKVGRASGHGFGPLWLELAWVALLFVLLVAMAAWLAARLAARVRDEPTARLITVALPLLSVVLVYLALVSFGRSALRAQSIQDAAEVFRFAYGRFHFFWATLLLPWLVVWGACAWAARAPRTAGAPASTPGSRAIVLGVALVCAVAGLRGVFDVGAYYRSASAFRAGEIRCLARQLGSGQAIGCPGFDAVGISDWTRAYLYARDIGASFVRYLPIVAREGFGQDVLHWHDGADFAAARWLNARAQSDGWLRSEGDAQMRITLPDAERLARCRVLGVQLGVRARRADAVQVFYRPRGQTDYSETQSVRKPYDARGDVPARLEFSFDSPAGFAPELRIDPVDGPGMFDVTQLRVTCRLLAPS